MNVTYGRGYVFALEYHIVWCTKYRRKVLSEPVEQVLCQILSAYASANGFSIMECNTDRDHIHLLIAATPQTYIPDIMKGMKGVSARMLFKQFPELKGKLWDGHLWDPSYFIATVSDQTEAQITEYIRSQKER